MANDDDQDSTKGKKNPFDSANIFNKFFSLWIFPFLFRGFFRTVKAEDIPNCPVKYGSERVHKEFEKKYFSSRNSRFPLIYALVKYVWFPQLVLEILYGIGMVLSLCSPFIQKSILEYLFPTDSTPEYVKHIGFAIGMVCLMVFLSIITLFFSKFQSELSNHIRLKLSNGLMSKLYRKILSLSPKSMNEMSNQSFITFMNVEVGQVLNLPSALGGLWKAPIMITASVILLFVNLSWPSFFVIAVIILFIPIYIVLTLTGMFVFMKILKILSENTKFITGVLKGIRVIKCNVWEEIFLKQMLKKRKKFVKYIVLFLVLMLTFGSLASVSPLVMQIVIFSVTFSTQKENFTISTVFPSLTYIMFFSSAVTSLPSIIQNVFKGSISLNRIQKLLKMEEFDSSFINDVENSVGIVFPIQIKDASFKWFIKPKKKEKMIGRLMKCICGCFRRKKRKTIFVRSNQEPEKSNVKENNDEGLEANEKNDVELQNIDIKSDNEEEGENSEVVIEITERKKSESIDHTTKKGSDKPKGGKKGEKEKRKIGKIEDIEVRINKGELICIIGEVGSGKTSLLSSMLGELDKVKGEVEMNGTISYCTQTPWIHNETVQNNILFGKEFDEDLLLGVIEACDLEKDLGLFPDGIYTEIGERGITLSGGQKQRISIARSLYSKSEIYILDDVLSAVDPHVASTIFKKGILGFLKGKTVILATNQLNWLPYSDFIIALDNGKIKEQGKYEDLIKEEDGFVKKLTDKFTIINDDEDLRKSDEETDGEEAKKENDEESRKKKKELLLRKDKDGKAKSVMEKEEIEKGTVKIRTIWFYFKSFGIISNTCCALITLFFLFLSVILMFFYGKVPSIWLSFWTTDYIHGIHDITYLVVYSVVGITVPFFFILIFFILSIFSLISGLRITKKVYQSLMNCPVGFWEKTPLGRVLNRLSRDQMNCDFLIFPVNRCLRVLFGLTFTFIFIAATSWFSIIPLLLIIPFYLIIQEFYRRSSRQIRRIQSVSRSPMIALLQETVDGVPVIRAYSSEDYFFKRFCEKVDKNLKVSFYSFHLNVWLNFCLGTFSIFFILCACMLIVCLKNFNFGISVLSGLSLSQMIDASSSLSSLVKTIVSTEQSFNSIERLSHYATKLDQESASIIKSNRPADSWCIEKKDIVFKDLSMRYREELPLVLKKLSFTVASCEKIGIVGRTGSGKTSIFNCILRIVEPEIDSKIIMDGMDICTIGLFDLRSRLSIIPQDPHLFEGTVRFNLDPEKKFSDEELWDILEKCRLKSTIMELEKGLDHDVDAGGTNFSLGERSLLCLARALIRKSKIILIDEGTASIDLKTESLIRETIKNEFKDCTMLTIAHRLNTIIDSDKILVMEEGEIKEYDSPDKLVENEDSIFRGMLKEMGEENERKLLEMIENEN